MASIAASYRKRDVSARRNFLVDNWQLSLRDSRYSFYTGPKGVLRARVLGTVSFTSSWEGRFAYSHIGYLRS